MLCKCEKYYIICQKYFNSKYNLVKRAVGQQNCGSSRCRRAESEEKNYWIFS